MRSIYDAALAALSPQPGGGFRLESGAADRLMDRLDRAEPPVTAKDLRPVLKLIAVLEHKPDSQAAAEGLIQVLRASPRAFTALSESRGSVATRARAVRQRLSTFEGRVAPNNVPTHDAPAPQGTLSARHLMRPIDSATAKAKRR